MLNTQHAKPETVAGSQSADILDKRGFAQRWHGSVRWVDGLLAQGLPHLKIGQRRVRIVAAEADAWMNETFRVQRRAAR